MVTTQPTIVQDEALMARNKEYTNWMMKIVTRTGAAFTFEDLQDLHAMCIGKSISSFNILLGFETFSQMARRFGYLDPMIVKRMFEVFDEDNSKQISFEELAYNIARSCRANAFSITADPSCKIPLIP